MIKILNPKGYAINLYDQNGKTKDVFLARGTHITDFGECVPIYPEGQHNHLGPVLRRSFLSSERFTYPFLA